MAPRTIFRGKIYRVQPYQITAVGGRWFERARKALATLAGWKSEDVSDADTVEYLARGAENTGRYINGEDIPPTKG